MSRSDDDAVMALVLARYRLSLQVPGLEPLTFTGADIPQPGPLCITFGGDDEREYDDDGQLVTGRGEP